MAHLLHNFTFQYVTLGAIHKRRRRFLTILDPSPPSYRPILTFECHQFAIYNPLPPMYNMYLVLQLLMSRRR